MKGRRILVRTLALSLMLSLVLVSGSSFAQGSVPQEHAVAPDQLGTAFNYQGQLKKDGVPVNGTCDFEFKLYNAASDGTQKGTTETKSGVPVEDGLFTVQLDFGGNRFIGKPRWLQIGARCPAGAGSFTTLTPRQPLTPVPYALAIPGLWTQQNETSPNLIGGFLGNHVDDGVVGGTIGGGGFYVAPPLRGGTNRVTDNYGTIAGGANNTVGDDDTDAANAPYSAVGGGHGNNAGGKYTTAGGGRDNDASGDWATVGGGDGNSAGSDFATVGGGEGNEASESWATVGGGDGNTAGGREATIGGGCGNTANGTSAAIGGGTSNSAMGHMSTVPGGASNEAKGQFSLAAGRRAKANHNGAFVWSDSGRTDFASTAADQFLVNASGGMGVGTNDPGNHGLSVHSSGSGPTGSTVHVVNDHADGIGMSVQNTSDDLTLLLSQLGEGPILRADSYVGGWHPVFEVENDGAVECSMLTITGGSDLSERFDVAATEGEIEPGMLVCIDTDQPGRLVVCNKVYDRTVAGVVAGAGGIEPGMVMGQAGSQADGAYPVALTGRVYVWADASGGAIQPGDLLTTSEMPGHAMKVTDFDQAHGAILGKAMSALDEETGLILVLIALQ